MSDHKVGGEQDGNAVGVHEENTDRFVDSPMQVLLGWKFSSHMLK
jgi:hypothetical protein